MKTIAKHNRSSGNLSLVQFEIREGEGLHFQVTGFELSFRQELVKLAGTQTS